MHIAWGVLCAYWNRLQQLSVKWTTHGTYLRAADFVVNFCGVRVNHDCFQFFTKVTAHFHGDSILFKPCVIQYQCALKLSISLTAHFTFAEFPHYLPLVFGQLVHQDKNKQRELIITKTHSGPLKRTDSIIIGRSAARFRVITSYITSGWLMTSGEQCCYGITGIQINLEENMLSVLSFPQHKKGRHLLYQALIYTIRNHSVDHCKIFCLFSSSGIEWVSLLVKNWHHEIWCCIWEKHTQRRRCISHLTNYCRLIWQRQISHPN